MKTKNLGSVLNHIQVLIDEENWPAALEELKAVDQKYSNTPAVLTAMGNCEIHIQQPEAAISCFEKVIELDPESVEALNNLAVAYMFSGEYVSSEETYLKALQFQPDHLPTLKNLAFLYYQQEERQGDAALLLANVIRKAPSDCEALYLMGMCYQAGGQIDSARVCFERVLEMQPDSTLAKDALSVLQPKSN
jgi:tetratricopeptide (TPR) repeat protein